MQIARARRVPWSCGQMRELVNDIARYPEFLPAVTAARVFETKQTESGEQQDAELQLQTPGASYQLRTRNLLADNQMHIGLLAGPFRHLEGRWLFRPVETGCEVSLELDMEPEGLVLRSLLRLFAVRAADRVMAAFEQRAGELYGDGQ